MSTTKTLEKKVVLTSAQFSSRQSAGTLQEGVEYNISDYDPSIDVQINGTSIVSSGVANIPLASASVNGAISTAQYTKLEGIDAGAEVNVLEGVQVNGSDLTITNKKVNIPNSSASVSGVMTSTQYTKLDGIEAGAEVNTVDSVDGETGAVVLNDVKYIAQTLTDSQKSVARTNIGIHDGATTLDATTVAGKQYILASQSATFNIVLPSTGTYNDEIEVVFPATAAFTPTSSGGTVVGDTLPTTVSGKTYDLLFSWVGTGWLLNWLAW